MNFLKKTVVFLLIISFFFPFLSFDALAKGLSSISARSACLMEAQSGKVLYSKSADTRLPMASTTKIMTALVTLESGIALDKVIRVPKQAVGVEGSSIYLQENEAISVSDLLYALMLESGNDAATALAISVGGSVEGFVELMNKKAEELGLTNTHFTNPHGLPDDGHYTTARELAVIMANAVKNDIFSEISGCKKKVVPKENDGVRVFYNHNRLLSSYSGVIAGKTGFTKDSGRCLVTCAERDGLRVICVTLNAPNDWNDHASLFDFAFANYKKVSFEQIQMDIPVISGVKDSVRVATESGIDFITAADNGEIEVKVEVPHFLYADIKKGDMVGKAVYYQNGKRIASLPIYTTESINKKHFGFNLFEWLSDLFKGLLKWN